MKKYIFHFYLIETELNICNNMASRSKDRIKRQGKLITQGNFI